MAAAQVANGAIPSMVAPAGANAAAAAGEVEREVAAAKAGTAKTGAAKAAAVKAAPAAQAKVAALPGAGAKVAAGAGKAGLGGGAGAKVVGGSLWTGKGLGLGLGLGLGAWGPVIIGVVGAAAVYAYMKSRDIEALQNDEEVELREALA